MIGKIHTSKNLPGVIPRTEVYLRSASRRVSPQPPLENFGPESYGSGEPSEGIIHAQTPIGSGAGAQRRHTDPIYTPDLSTESLAYLSKIEGRILMTSLFLSLFHSLVFPHNIQHASM